MKLAESIKDGFYFCCQQCGNCCSFNWEGTVLLFRKDIDNLIKELDISYESFIRDYTAIYINKFFIWDDKLNHVGERESENLEIIGFDMTTNKDCIFLEEKGQKKICKIYKAAPFQCRCFPFWNLLMTDEIELNNVKRTCKGFIKKEDLLKKGLRPEEYFYDTQKIISFISEERRLMRDYFQKFKKHKGNLSSIYKIQTPHFNF